MSDFHNQYSRLNLKFETKTLAHMGKRLDRFDDFPARDRLWIRVFSWSVGILSGITVLLLWLFYAS